LPTARHTARYNSVLRLSVSHIARLYKSICYVCNVIDNTFTLLVHLVSVC